MDTNYSMMEYTDSKSVPDYTVSPFNGLTEPNIKILNYDVQGDKDLKWKSVPFMAKSTFSRCHLTVRSVDDALLMMKVKYDDRVFTLIQDTNLPAGTKQRGIAFFQKLKERGIMEVVTYGTIYGYGQAATAWCCRSVGLLCTIFLCSTFPRTKMTRLAMRWNAHIIDVEPDDEYPTTSVLAHNARSYANKSMGRKLLEIGLDDPEFIEALSDGIRCVSKNINPKRIWVAGGSGVLSRALAKAFPNTELCIVQVGRLIYPDILANIRHKLYISPETFKNNAEIIPPYRSLRHYDAKVWRFVRIYGEDGDYIWNVK